MEEGRGMRQRAKDRIVEEVRRMIITEELAPGSLVGEAYLLDLLRCGRTPLREALQDLRHEYLVQIPVGRGVLIPELSIATFQHAYEAMLVLGTAAVELAAPRIESHDLAELKGLTARLEAASKAGDSYQMAELDLQFHTMLAQITRNPYLTDMLRRVHCTVERFVYRAHQLVGSSGSGVREHYDIIEALETGDGDLAKQRLSAHISGWRERVLAILGLGVEGHRL
jgi:DNA-binding GntR family transcriptional regulator